AFGTPSTSSSWNSLTPISSATTAFASRNAPSRKNSSARLSRRSGGGEVMRGARAYPSGPPRPVPSESADRQRQPIRAGERHDRGAGAEAEREHLLVHDRADERRAARDRQRRRRRAAARQQRADDVGADLERAPGEALRQQQRQRDRHGREAEHVQ